MSSCRRSAQGSVITGVIIVGVGVVLLLAQIGVFRFHDAWRFWPAVLVLFGVARLMDTPTPTHVVWGSTMILIGSLLLLHYFGHFRYGMDELWPLFVIGGGLSLLFQSYWPGKAPDGSQLQPGGTLNGVYIFGGTERNIKDSNFKGGRLFACFGGFQIDLTQADIAEENAVIDATAVFGGGEIRVPMNWNVVVEGIGVFGGYQDSTRHTAIEGKPTKNLYVRGAAIFGGVEVKN